jgi:transposase
LIGEDVTEVLEYMPSFFKVLEHVRPKVSCRTCSTILQAPLPSFPIERGRPGPALLAHVIVSKYADALPLHRQSVIYARAGVELDRSTMADWVGRMAALVDPLYEAIGAHVRHGGVLFADDTTVPVLAPGKGRTARLNAPSVRWSWAEKIISSPVPTAAVFAPRRCTCSSKPPNSMGSTRKPTCATCSHASPITPSTGSMNCSLGGGKP